MDTDAFRQANRCGTLTQTSVLLARAMALVALLVSASLYADQRSTSLATLFEELAAATDSIDANRIEGLIWEQWLKAPDEQAAKQMSQITRAMAAGDLSVALEFCDQLVESYPDYAEGWNKRATIHYMRGNSAESVADIRETIALEPRHFGAISGLGLIFLREGDLEAALTAFEKVLSISPASANARRSVERVRREMGREI